MIYSVQYLRGVAAILVLLGHSLFKIEQVTGVSNDWFSIGASGVDLFFIISGFIMCHATEGKAIDAFSFFKNRFLRIIPLYWLLSFLALIVFVLKPGLVNSSGGGTTIFNSFTLIPNGERFLIQNGWTLSFEFLFYIIFAGALAVKSNKIGFVSLVILFMVSVGVVFPVDNNFFEFITSPLLIEFVMGMFAYWIYNNKVFSRWFALGFILVGVGCLLVVNGFGMWGDRIVSYGFPYMLVFIGVTSFETAFFREKENFISKVMKLAGDASYSLYLSHPFVLAGIAVFLRLIDFNFEGFMLFFVLFVSSCVVGVLCYKFVETPLGNYFHRRKISRSLEGGALL